MVISKHSAFPPLLEQATTSNIGSFVSFMVKPLLHNTMHITTLILRVINKVRSSIAQTIKASIFHFYVITKD